MRPLSERVLEELEKIERASGLYHRLVLVVGPTGAGKTAALREAGARAGAPVVNVNLELSRRLLELAGRRRALRVRPLLEGVVAERRSGVVLLDNIELLFDAALAQNPLALLRSLARGRAIAAAWSGRLADGRLEYAEPGHPEHRRYPADGVAALRAEAPA